MPLNCGVGEDSQESLGLQGDQAMEILKEISPEYSLEGLMLKLKLPYLGHLMRRTDSLEKPWCWERLKAGGEGDDRGWDGWMAPLTQWTKVWVNPGSWWWTGRFGMLQSMGSQRVGHDWATELSWIVSHRIFARELSLNLLKDIFTIKLSFPRTFSCRISWRKSRSNVC